MSFRLIFSTKIPQAVQRLSTYWDILSLTYYLLFRRSWRTWVQGLLRTSHRRFSWWRRSFGRHFRRYLWRCRWLCMHRRLCRRGRCRCRRWCCLWYRWLGSAYRWLWFSYRPFWCFRWWDCSNVVLVLVCLCTFQIIIWSRYWMFWLVCRCSNSIHRCCLDSWYNLCNFGSDRP